MQSAEEVGTTDKIITATTATETATLQETHIAGLLTLPDHLLAEIMSGRNTLSNSVFI